MHSKIPLGPEPNKTDWQLGPKREALAVSTKEKERVMGIHNDNVLVLITEASGMPEDIMDGIDTLMAGGNCRLLLISQPSRREGTFYKAFTTERSLYHTIRIPYDITPNFKHGRTVRPYLITEEWVNAKRVKWGENSPLWDVHVMAKFPDDEETRLIPIDIIEAAVDRELMQEEPGVSLGSDIARFGRHLTVHTLCRGGTIEGQYAFRGESTMESAGRIKSFFELHAGIRVAVDATGVGGGVVDKLEEDGFDIVPVTFGSRANDSSRYADRLSEIYWHLRTDFMSGLLSLPRSLPYVDELMSQLSMMEYKYTSKGIIKVYKPDSYEHSSPDFSDSLALAREAQHELVGAEAFMV